MYRERDYDQNPETSRDASRIDVLDNTLPKKEMELAVGVFDSLLAINRVREAFATLRSLEEVDALTKTLVKHAHYIHNIAEKREFSLLWLAPDPEAMEYADRIYTLYHNPFNAESTPETYKDRALFFLHFWVRFVRHHSRETNRRNSRLHTMNKRSLLEAEMMKYGTAEPTMADLFRWDMATTFLAFPDYSFLPALLEHGGPDAIRWWWETFGGDDVVAFNAGMVGVHGDYGAITVHRYLVKHATADLADWFKDVFKL